MKEMSILIKRLVELILENLIETLFNSTLICITKSQKLSLLLNFEAESLMFAKLDLEMDFEVFDSCSKQWIGTEIIH